MRYTDQICRRWKDTMLIQQLLNSQSMQKKQEVKTYSTFLSEAQSGGIYIYTYNPLTDITHCSFIVQRLMEKLKCWYRNASLLLFQSSAHRLNFAFNHLFIWPIGGIMVRIQEERSEAGTWFPLWLERIWNDPMSPRCFQPTYLPMKYMCAEVCQRWIAFEQPLNTPVDMVKSARPAGMKWAESTMSTPDSWRVHKGGYVRITMFWHLDCFQTETSLNLITVSCFILSFYIFIETNIRNTLTITLDKNVC